MGSGGNGIGMAGASGAQVHQILSPGSVLLAQLGTVQFCTSSSANSELSSPIVGPLSLLGGRGQKPSFPQEALVTAQGMLVATVAIFDAVVVP